VNISSRILSFVYFITTLPFLTLTSQAQFVEDFDGIPASHWITFTGDGYAESSLEWFDGYARFTVDATNDWRNVWWAIMQTSSIDTLDLSPLAVNGYELRMEARVKTSHAPRRLNMQLRTQHTTDYYAHLMEFDIPDTSGWHTISMTTQHFEAEPGDAITAHIALMDWGPLVYTLDVDYVKVDVVNISEANPDAGEKVPYPPPVPHPDDFIISVPAIEAGIIDRAYPDINLAGWVAGGNPVLTTDNNKIVLLRWNLYEYRGREVSGNGMLELTPYSFYNTTETGKIEFDQIRIVEILGGNPAWTNTDVTFNHFLSGSSLLDVLNTQMIIDIDIPNTKDTPVWIHIPEPVIRRLLDGTTKGIALYPLGLLSASFYSGDSMIDPFRPRLYFSTE
jgi:hypothetical protein